MVWEGMMFVIKNLARLGGEKNRIMLYLWSGDQTKDVTIYVVGRL